MGNCQAIDAAALVIQHPNGRIERMYWAMSASEVMKMNPGHYVSLIIPLPISGEDQSSDDKTVRFTRVKLLRPTDTLVLGRAYRLVTTQEVMKVLRAKKHAKMRSELAENSRNMDLEKEKQSSVCEAQRIGSQLERTSQATTHERVRQRLGSTNLGAAKSKAAWCPSLQSISEAGS